MGRNRHAVLVQDEEAPDQALRGGSENLRRNAEVKFMPASRNYLKGSINNMFGAVTRSWMPAPPVDAPSRRIHIRALRL